ncbi:HK97-gp10 family putative phage morphogenesis protein [Streptococcus sp. 10F2]
MGILEIKGDEPLLKHLQTAASLKAHKEIVRKHGSNLQKGAQRRATFRGHYQGKKFVKPTGATKRSIKLQITDGGFAAKVATGTHYSGYLEKGTRKMSAQPFMRPAFEEVQSKFVDDLRRAGIAK